MKLRQVRSENVEKAYDAAQGVSASILEQTHKVTNRMFNFAIENELAITENPSHSQWNRCSRDAPQQASPPVVPSFPVEVVLFSLNVQSWEW